jgi:hypothetical protein
VVLSHPLRAVALLFAGMAALVVACAPFVPEVAPLLFLGAGLPYCLSLALFAVGLVLALPSRAVCWWLLSGVVPLLGEAGFWLLLRSDPDTLWRVFPHAVHGLLAVLGAWLLAGLAVAGSGWVRYMRCARQTGHGQEPGRANG